MDVADRAGVNLLHRLLIAVRVPHLRAGLDGESQFARFPSGVHHPAHANRVGRDRLFDEDVFAGGHRRLKTQRAVARRRGEQHEVDVGLQQFAERVLADEAVVRRHLDALF